jgi:MFS family permease
VSVSEDAVGTAPPQLTGAADQIVEEYPPGYRALGVVPDIWRLLISSVCARTATRIYVILLVLFVLADYHSTTLSGLAVLASQLPGLVLSPLAGALLDRRGRIGMVATDFMVASVALALITILGVLHLLPIWSLFVIVVLSSLTQPLSSTGTRSLFPVIVPRPLWDRANGLDGSSFVVATIFGPVIAGFAVVVVGTSWALFVPVVLYLIAGSILIGVRVPPPAVATMSLLESSLAAVRYVFTNKTLRQLSATVTIYNGGVGTMSVAIPVLVLHHLHGGATTTGLMLATLGLGGSISSIFMGAVGTAGREHKLMMGACLAAGILLCLLSFSVHEEFVAYLCLFGIGLTNGPLNITMFSVRQRVTDPEWFGRAFAISMSLNAVGIPLGAAVIGAVIGHSIVFAFVLAGVCTLSAGAWSAIFPFDPSYGASSEVVTVHPASAEL